MEAIRNMYSKMGVSEYYKEYGNSYKNPHSEIINSLLKTINPGKSMLDLCCGSGEVSLNFPDIQVIGCDPYTFEQYKENTGREVLTFNFKEIAMGALEGLHFDTIICSFALHLCDESLLNTVLYQLTRISSKLIVITPHKKPEIKNFWKLEKEIIQNRVRLREYSSLI